MRIVFSVRPTIHFLDREKHKIYNMKSKTYNTQQITTVWVSILFCEASKLRTDYLFERENAHAHNTHTLFILAFMAHGNIKHRIGDCIMIIINSCLEYRK